jgi:hypothetical protein
VTPPAERTATAMKDTIIGVDLALEKKTRFAESVKTFEKEFASTL